MYQTIKDYSILVQNLPVDVKEPQIYKFFQKWGEVHNISIIRDITETVKLMNAKDKHRRAHASKFELAPESDLSNCPSKNVMSERAEENPPAAWDIMGGLTRI
jgi:hypothetical protein